MDDGALLDLNMPLGMCVGYSSLFIFPVKFSYLAFKKVCALSIPYLVIASSQIWFNILACETIPNKTQEKSINLYYQRTSIRIMY